MSILKKNLESPYLKFRDLRIYGSSEWLANQQKKYRRVYDKSETSYIYAELSVYNKKFAEEDWVANATLKAYMISGDKRQELCSLQSEKKVSKQHNIFYIREGWGNKKPGLYWKKGTYEWEAYIDDVLVATQTFYIEDVGLVTEDNNPYFNIKGVKLYEGPNNNPPTEQRKYYRSFDGEESRYIFVELDLENLVRKNNWHCELGFKFYNDAHQLKGETVEITEVKSDKAAFSVTSGWGSNEEGTWFPDKYTLEVLFMDQLIAILPFEVGYTFEEGFNEVHLPGLGAAITTTKDAESKDETFEEVMSSLEALIGLSSIKKKIKSYSEYLKFIKIRTEKGFEDNQKVNLHTVFTGNPGTGKTTVAKKLGKIYKQMGLLSKGHLVEVDRGDLVGEYIGQTAPKVKEVIKNARGGIIFIDEAYSLARTKDDSKDFGREVIEILLKEMSDGKGDLVIIVAGYPNEMHTFMDANPGLKSRFSQWFEFPDYLPQDLANIADFAAEQRNIILSPQAKLYLYDKIVEAYRTRDKYFGNARFVHNLLEQAKINLGLRVMKTDNPRKLNKEELSTVLIEDIENIFTSEKGLNPDIPVDEAQLQEALNELNAMIGLKEVRKEITELVQLVRFYREEGKEVLNKFSLHTVFTGNPGTGKTTVARILAKIYKALGILERGHLVETDRQGLIAGYVGQTALKTASKIDEAIGGVLFLDEAYALTQRGGADYGKEAIETLIKRMEDQKGEFAIVAAGYPKPMKAFMEANPGLKSRFDRILNFEDFSVEELFDIAKRHLQINSYKMTDEAAQSVLRYLGYLHANRDRYFGNGRTVVKMVNEIIKQQNLRLAAIPHNERDKAMLKKITLQDVNKFDEDKVLKSKGPQMGFQRGSNAPKE